MRIDILPKTAPHAVEPGSPKPESGQLPDIGAFSAVMYQLAAPAAGKSRTKSQGSSPEVEQKDDHPAENIAAPISPFVFESRGIRKDALSRVTPARMEPSAGRRCTAVEGPAGAGDGRATADPGSSIVHHAHSATERQRAANSEAAAVPVSSAPGPARDHVPAGSYDEKAVSVTPTATTVVEISKTGSPEAQPMEGSAPPASAQQTGAGQASEDSRASNSVAGEPALQMEISSAVCSAESAQVVPAGLTANPALPAAPPQAGSLEALAQEIQASELNSPHGSSVVAPSHAETTDAANLTGGSPGPDAVTQSRAERIPPAPNLHSVGDRDGEIRPLARHSRTVDQSATAPTETQPPTDARYIPNEFAFVVDSAVRAHLEESQDLSNATNWTAGNKTLKETSGEHPESGVGSVESGLEGAQTGQRAVFHGQSTSTGTSDAPVFAGSRPPHSVGSTSSASWEAGLQLLQHTAGTGLKSILAQLAPRPGTPAEAPDFLALLAGRIQMLVRDNQNILTIQLKPSSLGRMEIKAETSAAGVLATIVTESAGVKNYLEHNLPLLQQCFQDQGLKIDRISVAVQDGSWPQQPAFGHRDTSSSPSPQNDSGFRTRPGNSFAEPAEELALDPQTLLSLRPNSTFHTIA